MSEMPHHHPGMVHRDGLPRRRLHWFVVLLALLALGALSYAWFIKVHAPPRLLQSPRALLTTEEVTQVLKAFGIHQPPRVLGFRVNCHLGDLDHCSICARVDLEPQSLAPFLASSWMHSDTPDATVRPGEDYPLDTPVEGGKWFDALPVQPTDKAYFEKLPSSSFSNFKKALIRTSGPHPVIYFSLESPRTALPPNVLWTLQRYPIQHVGPFATAPGPGAGPTFEAKWPG